MPLFKAYQTDKDLEREGAWVHFILTPGKDEFKVKVARIGGGNTNFQKIFERVRKPHKRALQLETASAELEDQLMREAIAEGIVKGWQTMNEATSFKWVDGVQLEDGKIVPLSKATLLEIFTALPDVFQDIVDRAMKFGLFRAQELEDDSKN